MTTICPGCYRAIGQTPHCATCRAHNDPAEHCYCPECDPDGYRADTLAMSDDDGIEWGPAVWQHMDHDDNPF